MRSRAVSHFLEAVIRSGTKHEIIVGQLVILRQHDVVVVGRNNLFHANSDVLTSR